MAWKVTVAILFALSDTADAQACRIDGFSMMGADTLVAARDGYYAAVKPEFVCQEAYDISSDLADAGFTSLDGFSIDKTSGISYITSGSEWASFGESGFIEKQPFPQAMIDAGFDSVNGFSIIGTTHVAFTKKGEDGFLLLDISGESGSTEPVVEKHESGTTLHPFPSSFADNGFTSIDAMTYAMDASGWMFVATKGSHYIHITGSLTDEVGSVVGGGKQCMPAVLTSNGFNSLDGMSLDPSGNVWVVKGTSAMCVTPGEVVVPKTAFPASMVDLGFDTIDAFSITPDNTQVWFAKGSKFVGYLIGSEEPINGAPSDFSTKLTDAGFTSIQGLTIVSDTEYCVAADGHYMCLDAETDTVTAEKTAFPSSLSGYTKIDGILARDGYVAVTADGYFTVIDSNDQVVINKQALPSTLTDQLCGPAACIGGLALGSADAPAQVAADDIADDVLDEAPLPSAAEVGATDGVGDALPPAPAPSPSVAASAAASKVVAASTAVQSTWGAAAAFPAILASAFLI